MDETKKSFYSNINNIISINSNYLSNLGLYLFLQVQLPLSLATVKHLHFLVIGWGGCPAITVQYQYNIKA